MEQPFTKMEEMKEEMKEEMVVGKMRIWLETHSLNFADLIIFIWGFGDRISHSPGWLQTYYLGEDDLER